MKAHRKIGEQRYRERIGPSYDEIVVGDVFEHRPGRTITESDCVLGSLIFMNPHPIHIDADYAGRTGFGKLLVNSSITLGIVSGMTVRSTSGQGTANLGWDRIRLRSPVFVGDTLYAESRIADKRPSNSRPGDGIVTIVVTARNQRDEVVLTYERAFLIPISDQSIDY
jgi:itaconyl-CoA hydratase